MKNNADTKELIWFENLKKLAFDLSILGWVGFQVESEQEQRELRIEKERVCT